MGLHRHPFPERLRFGMQSTTFSVQLQFRVALDRTDLKLHTHPVPLDEGDLCFIVNMD